MKMSFLINEANLPATLTAAPMTDEEFTAFCAEHPDLNFEMTAEGEIVVNSSVTPQAALSCRTVLAARPMRPGR